MFCASSTKWRGPLPGDEIAARWLRRACGDERELLACNGIGPTKLERYGDDILAVLATVR